MKLSKGLWTIIIDAVVSVAGAAIGIWVVPERLDFALIAVAALQSVAVGLVVHFAAQEKIAALEQRVEIFTQGK